MNCSKTHKTFNKNLLTSESTSPLMLKKDRQIFYNVTLASSSENLSLQKTLDNNEVLYFVLACEVNIEGILYNTYGIGAVKNNILVDYILDLSIDFKKVKSFVNLCNENNLSLIHFKDVAEDLLIV